MKKTVVLFAAMVMAAVSCQKENSTKLGNDAQGSGKLTATFVQSKVSYTETSNNNIQPAWEIGDKIIGFDETGDTYTLTVASGFRENQFSCIGVKVYSEFAVHLKVIPPAG